MNMIYLQMVLCAIVGYLLGNIQTGLILGKLSGNVDLREHGSGSGGATNVLRVLGKKASAFTFLGDFLKGVIASLLGMLIAGWHGGMVAAVFVVVGHIWPAFFGFRGGKGVATALGALAILVPWHTLLLAVVGVVVLIPTKIVSLASIAGATVFLISGVISAIVRQDWFMLAFVIIMSALVIFAHRANIRRIMKGEEKKITETMKK